MPVNVSDILGGGKPPPEWYIRQGGDYNDVLKYLDLHEIAAEIDSKCKIFEICICRRKNRTCTGF